MRYLIALIMFLFLFTYQHTIAQISKLPGQWSVVVNGNIMTSYGISSAMRGTGNEFYNDMSRDYNNSKYPFGDGNTKNMNIGLLLSYRLPESRFSPYFSWNLTNFWVDELIRRAMMFISSFTLGCEYTLGNMQSLWNTFGRAGINMNFIGGQVENWGFKADVSPVAIRYGFEAGVGGRLNIPSTPLSVEISADYINTNVIGKGYRAPITDPPNLLSERALNDAANPNNPNDKDRTIDYILLKAGIRLWL